MAGTAIESCKLCLQRLSRGRTRTLRCQHVFHKDCIQEMRKYCKSDDDCPLCRLSSYSSSERGSASMMLERSGQAWLQGEVELSVSMLHAAVRRDPHNAIACAHLSNHYRKGTGVDKDLAKAKLYEEQLLGALGKDRAGDPAPSKRRNKAKHSIRSQQADKTHPAGRQKNSPPTSRSPFTRPRSKRSSRSPGRKRKETFLAARPKAAAKRSRQEAEGGKEDTATRAGVQSGSRDPAADEDVLLKSYAAASSLVASRVEAPASRPDESLEQPAASSCAKDAAPRSPSSPGDSVDSNEKLLSRLQGLFEEISSGSDEAEAEVAEATDEGSKTLHDSLAPPVRKEAEEAEEPEAEPAEPCEAPAPRPSRRRPRPSARGPEPAEPAAEPPQHVEPAEHAEPDRSLATETGPSDPEPALPSKAPQRKSFAETAEPHDKNRCKSFRIPVEGVLVLKNQNYGAAIVTVPTARVRQAMVDACQRVTIQDEKVKVSAYENQDTALYVYWSTKDGSASKLPQTALEEYFRSKYDQVNTVLEEQFREWLRGLDKGRGVLLQYFPALKQKFNADTSRLLSMKVGGAGSAGVRAIDPALWDMCEIKPLGHRAMFSRGICELADQMPAPRSGD